MDQSARRRQRPQISRPTHEHHRFGKRLRDLRKRKGLSQAQLVRELSQRHTSGLSQTNISHLERRKTNIETRLASLADGGCAGKPLYDEPIPREILEQVRRWQARSAMLED